MKKLLCLLFIGTFILSGCAGSKTHRLKSEKRISGRRKELAELKEQVKVKNYITVMGIGVAAEELKGTQQRASAREAAIAMAQYQLAGVIKGVEIDGKVTVEKASEKDSHIEASVNKLLKAARVVKTEWLPDGGCIVTLKLDFEGTMNGLPLENGSASGHEMRVGEKKMIPGFEDQLIGHVQDEEFEVSAVLPADWNQKMRRISFPIPGAPDEKQEDDRAVFKVKIKKIRTLHLPELTDEIAQREGFDTVADLRRAIKIDLQNHKEQHEELKIKEDIFNMLVKDAEMEPPESVIERELKFMIEGMKFQIAQSGMKPEDSGFEPEKAMKEWREKAVFNTTGYMMLESIAAAENIHLTQQDMEGEYELLAKQTKQKVEEVQKRIMSNPDSLGQTTIKLLGQKTMNFIYANCEIEYYKEGEEPKEEPKKES